MTSPPLSDDSAKIAKVSALLTLAEHPGTPVHEAELAMARAQKLIATFMLDEATVRAHDPHAPADPFTVTTMELPAPYSRERAFGFSELARITGCQVTMAQNVYNSAKSGRKVRTGLVTIRIFGRTRQVQRLEMLFRSLNTQVTAGLISYRGTTYGRKLTRSYVLGFLGQVTHRMAVIIERQRDNMTPAASNSYGLALRSDLEIAEQMQLEASPGITESAPSKADQRGLLLGARDGARADIGQDRMTAGSRLEIGSAS